MTSQTHIRGELPSIPFFISIHPHIKAARSPVKTWLAGFYVSFVLRDTLFPHQWASLPAFWTLTQSSSCVGRSFHVWPEDSGVRLHVFASCWIEDVSWLIQGRMFCAQSPHQFCSSHDTWMYDSGPRARCRHGDRLSVTRVSIHDSKPMFLFRDVHCITTRTSQSPRCSPWTQKVPKNNQYS